MNLQKIQETQHPNNVYILTMEVYCHLLLDHYLICTPFFDPFPSHIFQRSKPCSQNWQNLLLWYKISPPLVFALKIRFVFVYSSFPNENAKFSFEKRQLKSMNLHENQQLNSFCRSLLFAIRKETTQNIWFFQKQQQIQLSGRRRVMCLFCFSKNSNTIFS